MGARTDATGYAIVRILHPHVARNFRHWLPSASHAVKNSPRPLSGISTRLAFPTEESHVHGSHAEQVNLSGVAGKVRNHEGEIAEVSLRSTFVTLETFIAYVKT